MNELPTPPESSEIGLPPQHHSLFFGRFGLRAGFGILIFLVVATILTIVGGMSGLLASGQSKKAAAAYGKSHSRGATVEHLDFAPSFVLGNDGVEFIGLLGFCWLMSRAEQRPLGFYGIGRLRTRDALAGAAWGIVSMSLLVLFLKARGLIVFDGLALHGPSIVGFGVFWLIAFIAVGFSEEYLFRGYMLYTLTRGMWGLAERLTPASPKRTAFWIAATLMSLTFGALHMLNGGENAFGIFEVFFIGMTFSYAVWRTGSLWWGIGYHALWDFMQSYTFGVADSGNISVARLFVTHPQGSRLLSGGSDGPEGSLYSVVFVILTFFAIRFTTQRGEYPPPEPMPFETHAVYESAAVDAA